MNNLTLDDTLISLLERVAQQDTAAMRTLYEATSSKLYAVAMRVVSNTEHAEDVLQDAYLNIWRIAGDYRASLSPPMAWMGVVVRSRASFGTLDELFELLTLRQTGKMAPLPIVLYDRTFWRTAINFEHFAAMKVINPADLTLFDFADDPAEAWDTLLKHGLKVPASQE